MEWKAEEEKGREEGWSGRYDGGGGEGMYWSGAVGR